MGHYASEIQSDEDRKDRSELSNNLSTVAIYVGSWRIDLWECRICGALVSRESGLRHAEWHKRAFGIQSKTA